MRSALVAVLLIALPGSFALASVAKNRNFNMALRQAALRADDQRVQVLLNLGANPNAPDAEGNTALHLAESVGSVELLLARGASIKLLNRIGQSPLIRHVVEAQELTVYIMETERDIIIDKAENPQPSESRSRLEIQVQKAKAKLATLHLIIARLQSQER